MVLYLILSGKAQGWTGSLGQNGWGAGYNGASAARPKAMGRMRGPLGARLGAPAAQRASQARRDSRPPPAPARALRARRSKTFTRRPQRTAPR